MSPPGIVIVGASYAGVSAAISARTAGYRASITIVGNESYQPYQRPPLSKRYLKGEVDEQDLLIRAPAFYDSMNIRLSCGADVVSLDRRARTIELGSGEILGYHKLVLATGSRARVLTIPGCETKGVFYLRTLSDAAAIRRALRVARSVVVVGGGFIGLEIAASARQMGLAVSVLEAQARLLSRSMPPELAHYIASRHAMEGVKLRFDAHVTSVNSTNGHVKSLTLGDGTTLDADLVVIGIGVSANQELAASASLECRDGIVVDTHARTLDPHIYAAGDCTVHPGASANEMIRLECVQNANDQGKVAGANAAGDTLECRNIPWFWSDQYDLKFQGAGSSRGCDEFVVRGEMASDSFSIFYFSSGKLVAVDSINKPGEHMTARKLLAANSSISPGDASNPSLDLRTLIASPASVR